MMTIIAEDEKLRELRTAEQEHSSATVILQRFVADNFRMAAGGLFYVSSQFNRAELDRSLQTLTEAVDVARTRVQSALAALDEESAELARSWPSTMKKILVARAAISVCARGPW